MIAVADTAAAFSGAVFTVAAGAKARRRAETALFLRDVGLPWAADRVASVVPWAESLLAVCLLTGAAGCCRAGGRGARGRLSHFADPVRALAETEFMSLLWRARRFGVTHGSYWSGSCVGCFSSRGPSDCD